MTRVLWVGGELRRAVVEELFGRSDLEVCGAADTSEARRLIAAGPAFDWIVVGGAHSTDLEWTVPAGTDRGACPVIYLSPRSEGFFANLIASRRLGSPESLDERLGRDASPQGLDDQTWICEYHAPCKTSVGG